MSHRTRQQEFANDIDHDMFNLSEKLYQFAASINVTVDREPLLQLSRILSARRAYARKHMHPEDLKGTE